MFVIIPIGVFLIMWGVLAILSLGMAAFFLILGILLIPFKISLGILNVGVQILLWPLSLLTGRHWR